MVSLTLRLGVTLLLLAWVAERADFGAALARVAALDGWVLAAAVALGAAALALASLRWYAVLAGAGTPRPWPLVWRLTMGAALLDQCLPAGGGELARMWLAQRTGLSRESAAGGVLADRALDLAGHLPLLLPLLPLSLSTAGAWPLLALVAALLPPLLLARLDRRPLPGQRGARLRALLARAAATLHAILRTPRLAARVLLPALAAHLLRVVLVGVVAAALGVELAPLDALALLPPALLLAGLPLALNGWGLREALFVALLAHAGVAAADALALALAVGVGEVLSGLLGLLARVPLRGRLAATTT